MLAIKITKKDGSSHVVPAGQRKEYEGFNAKYKKLKKLDDIVTISEDFEYVEPAAAGKNNLSAVPPTPPAPPVDKAKTALDVIAMINAATTAEEVNTAWADDQRVSVIKAKDAKIEALTAAL